MELGSEVGGRPQIILSTKYEVVIHLPKYRGIRWDWYGVRGRPPEAGLMRRGIPRRTKKRSQERVTIVGALRNVTLPWKILKSKFGGILLKKK